MQLPELLFQQCPCQILLLLSLSGYCTILSDLHAEFSIYLYKVTFLVLHLR